MVWDGIIATYLFLAGLGAGAFAFAALVGFVKPDAVKLRTIGYVIAPIAVGVGTVLLMVDAKAGLMNPLRFFGLLGNFSSIMAWGVVILIAFMAVSVISLVVMIVKKGTPKALDVVGLVCAVAVAVYTGMLLGDAPGFPLWNPVVLPLLFLGFYGEAGFGEAQVMQIISLIIPFILGMVLGNMDMDIRKVFAGGNAIILPFLGFEFGSTINLIDAVKILPQGLLMSVIYFIIVITPSYIFERTVLHRPGYASVASGSLAGVALVIPSMAAASNTAFEPYVTSAVAILAFVLAVTNILCPFMVKFILTKHPADEQPRQDIRKLADAKQ